MNNEEFRIGSIRNAKFAIRNEGWPRSDCILLRNEVQPCHTPATNPPPCTRFVALKREKAVGWMTVAA